MSADYLAEEAPGAPGQPAQLVWRCQAGQPFEQVWREQIDSWSAGDLLALGAVSEVREILRFLMVSAGGR